MTVPLEAGSALLRRVPALLDRARALLRLSGGPGDRLSPGELAKAARAVEALHLGLVGERPLARAATYDEAAHLGAYLLWWWPQSYAKVRAAIELAPLPPALVAAGRVRLLDLGAGPGPAAIALVDLLTARRAEVRESGQAPSLDALAVDASPAALAEARALSGGALRTEEADLSRGLRAEGPFELICAAHLLSELPAGAGSRAAFVRSAASLLAPGGLLLLVEPALRETGRALLEVRDQLLAPESKAPRLRALAPCFTQRPCPALDHPRDWCTAERPWEPPPHLLQLSRELGLHAEAPLQFAPLLLTSIPAGDSFPYDSYNPTIWRVVGVPPAEKGKKRLFVCNDRGRVPVVRLDRDKASGNAGFDALGRGDVVRLAGLAEKGDGLRIGRESSVEPSGAEEHRPGGGKDVIGKPRRTR